MLYAEMLIFRDVMRNGELVETPINVTISGYMRRAQPDVGIMAPYAELETATDDDGRDIELTPDEIERAEWLLWEAR